MSYKKVNRYEHTGKTLFEKKAYKNFLSSRHDLDKTEKDPININQTDESSFEEEKNDTPKIQKKSKLLTIKDLLHDNWVVAIVGSGIVGLCLLLFTLYTSLNREQGVQGEKISTIGKNVETLNKTSEESKNNFTSFKECFNIFKVEMSKDLGFIKDELKTQSGTDKREKH